MAVTDTTQFVTLKDSDTRFIARELYALGGQYSEVNKEWVFPGGEYDVKRVIDGREQTVKVFSPPESDLADALLELYHATRPTPEQMEQLRQIAARVPLVTLGIKERPGTKAAQEQLERLLNPHVTSRGTVEYYLSKTVGFLLDASPEQQKAINVFVEKRPDLAQRAWGFDPKAEAHKIASNDAKPGEKAKITQARAAWLLSQAKIYLAAEKNRERYQADRALLEGDLERRQRGIDYTRTTLSDNPELLNVQARLNAESGIDDRRLAAMDTKRAHDRKAADDAAHGKRPDELRPQDLGFDPNRAGLAEERAERDRHANALGKLQHKLGEMLETTTGYSATDVVMRAPRAGTIVKGTVVAFETFYQGDRKNFIAAIQHENSPKTFTYIDTSDLAGRISNGAYVKIAMNAKAAYQLVLAQNGDKNELHIVDVREQSVLDALQKGELRQASGIMTLDEAQAFAKERGFTVAQAPQIETGGFDGGSVLFAGIGAEMQAEINKISPEVAQATWGCIPAKEPDFFKNTSAEQGREMLEAAVMRDPQIIAAAQIHALMQERAVKAGAQGSYEIPIDRTMAGTFAGEVVYNEDGIVGIDRGFNRWSKVDANELKTKLAQIKVGDKLQFKVDDSDKITVTKTPKAGTTQKRTVKM